MKIYKGVICEVIGGTDNLNIGKTVTVASLQGDHSKYGRIWRCTANNCQLITEYGAVGISADFAQDWLKPIPPLPLDIAMQNEKVKA
jgi:hypothetical protein